MIKIKHLSWVALSVCAVLGMSFSDRSAQEILTKTSRAFNYAAQKAMPSVVSISAVKKIAPQASGLPFLFDSPDFPGNSARQAYGIGSGVIIRANGFILTNHHVIEGADRVHVGLDEKHKVVAHIVGTDPKTDLAVLLLDEPKTGLQPISFGNSNEVNVGDWAIAIGSPFGLSRSVSSGIISAKSRGHMGILDTEDFLQTDAAINPGSSGGPLLNINGELIGVNTAIFSHGGGFMGIGFAIPSKIAQEVSDQIIAHGKVKRGWLGVIAQDLDEDLAKYFKVSPHSGALVSEVLPGAPASKGGLKPGDIVVKFGDNTLTDASDFKTLVAKSPKDAEIQVNVVRNGDHENLKVSVGEQPSPKTPPSQKQQAGQAAPQAPSLGFAVDEVPKPISDFLKVPRGLGVMIMGVKPGSPAFESGFAAGDIILSVNKKSVHNVREFIQITKKVAQEPLSVFYVQRGPEEKLFVPLKNTG